MPGAEAHRLVSEFEHLLRTRGCPVCAYVAESERSFWSWFEIESFSAVEMHARLRTGVGMCPAHLRTLIDQVGGGHIMTTVVREALAGARQLVRGELQAGACPACEALGSAVARATQLVADGLLDQSTARRYRDHGGMCLPHALDAVRSADRAAVIPVAERLLAGLTDEDRPATVEALAGRDPDAVRRAGWRERLPRTPGAGSTLERLCARLEIEACPVCLAAGLADSRFLEWFVERRAHDDGSLATDPGEFCAAHLHDLALIDARAVSLPVQRKRAARSAELRRFVDRLAQAPPVPRRGRRAVDDLARWTAELVAERHCPACNARAGVERSQLELLGASLSLPAVRECYERSHGLCVRHVQAVTGESSVRVVRRQLDARLAVLAWEVGETARKYGWAYRHEHGGPEQDAWARSLAQLDGRVFEGGPARCG
ncbi:MAG: hypothetical protein ABSG43_16925 [Solirubrobacteraceae bacterium]